MKKKSAKGLFFILVLLVLVLFIMGLFLGSARLSFREVLDGLFGGSGKTAVIVRTLRFPRVLAAALSGAALSAAGLLLQTISGNQLASPNLTGVNAGAGFFVMVLLVFFPAAYHFLPFFAFAGGILAVSLVLLVSRLAGGHNQKITLILTGVALSSVFSAGIAFLSQIDPDAVSSYVYFSTGGFQGIYLKDLLVPGILILICLFALIPLIPGLNLLCLGDDLAGSMGVPVTKIRIFSLLLAALLTASSVSFAGMIGFVGLMVPHIAARLFGHDMKKLVPGVLLIGPALCILADMLGRTLFAPSEISAGILLSFIGSPFFVFLLMRRNRHA